MKASLFSLKWKRWLILITLLFFVQCQPAPTEAECVMLLDRYTEFMIEQSRLKSTESQREALKHQARQQAFNDPEFWRCSDAVSRSAYNCAMKAANADEIERCLL